MLNSGINKILNYSRGGDLSAVRLFYHQPISGDCTRSWEEKQEQPPQPSYEVASAKRISLYLAMKKGICLEIAMRCEMVVEMVVLVRCVCEYKVCRVYRIVIYEVFGPVDYSLPL